MTLECVYVLRTEAGPLKIGVSANPEKRAVECRQYGFGKCELLHVVTVERPYAVERKAHKRLKPYRAKSRYREFFRVSLARAKAAIEQAILDVEADRVALEMAERARLEWLKANPPRPACECIAYSPTTCALHRKHPIEAPCRCECHADYRRLYGNA